jgi:hypothetical protein
MNCSEGMIYGDGASFGGAEYPVFMPGDGAMIGPQLAIPGETIPAPSGELLPEPAQP